MCIYGCSWRQRYRYQQRKQNICTLTRMRTRICATNSCNCINRSMKCWQFICLFAGCQLFFSQPATIKCNYFSIGSVWWQRIVSQQFCFYFFVCINVLVVFIWIICLKPWSSISFSFLWGPVFMTSNNCLCQSMTQCKKSGRVSKAGGYKAEKNKEIVY